MVNLTLAEDARSEGLYEGLILLMRGRSLARGAARWQKFAVRMMSVITEENEHEK